MKSQLCATFVLLALAVVGRADDNVCNADNSGVVRPCLDLDLDCIREYFQEHADCEAVKGNRDTASYDLEYAAVNLLLFNVTYEAYDNTVIYTDADIVDFTVNEKKKLAVLTVDFEAVNMLTRNGTLVYYRPGKEPRNIVAATLIVYPSVTLNIYFSTETWDLTGKRPFGYVNASPVFELNGDCLEHEDEELVPLIKQLFENKGAAARESWSYLGTPVAHQYVQNNICDFGVEY